MVLKMKDKVLADGVIRLYKSTEPQRFKDGEQCRDFIYIKDAVRMTCDFLLPQNISAAGLFNIGRGETSTWNQLACALFAALGKKENIEYVDMPTDLARQYQNYTCADMSKFQKVFPGYRPTAIADAVRDYAQEYLLRNARW
jgi:ADP-L-glycero-D-manno-heptose 6-epimerase